MLSYLQVDKDQSDNKAYFGSVLLLNNQTETGEIKHVNRSKHRYTVFARRTGI